MSPDNPVVLRDFSFHTVWVNTRALELAGITRDTVPPPGGVIDRDAAGEPIGLLRESAQQLVLAVLPPLPPDQLRGALSTAVGVLLSQGITSYTDPGLTPDEIDVYRDALANDALGARVTLMLTSSDSLLIGGTGGGSVEQFERMLARYPRPQVFDERLLALRAVKIFADGIPPNRTAWVYEPYADLGGTGELVLAGATEDERVAELRAIVRRAHEAGYQVGVHVTGDRAIDTVVDAFVSANRDHPRDDARHYVIHGDFVSADNLVAMAKHGYGVNMNPAIKWTISDLMDEVVGPVRSGVPVAGAGGVRRRGQRLRQLGRADHRPRLRGRAWPRCFAARVQGERARASGPEQRVGLASVRSGPTPSTRPGRTSPRRGKARSSPARSPTFACSTAPCR